ncbi:MAG: VPLPA-CTERM sorting domain-containing protein [Pseudomonadota bacterium]
MTRTFYAALAAVCLAGTSNAATMTSERRVSLSDLSFTAVACSTGSNPSCSNSGGPARSVTLDAFDTSLGTLNSVTFTYGFGIAGNWILRGDNLAAPIGDFTSSVSLKRGARSVASTTTSGDVRESALRNSTTDTFATEQFGAIRFSGTTSNAIAKRTFDDLAAGGNGVAGGFGTFLSWTFDVDLSVSIRSDLACDGSRIFGSDLNPCGATNRITGLTAPNYNFGPVIGPANFWFVRATYDFTAPPPPMAPEVPLPASAVLLLGALFGFGAARRPLVKANSRL